MERDTYQSDTVRPDRQTQALDRSTKGWEETSRATAGQLGREMNEQANLHTGGNSVWERDRSDRQKDCQRVSWTDKRTTQETHNERVLSGGPQEGINSRTVSRNQKSLSLRHFGRVPAPGLALQLISAGPLKFQAGPGRPPRLSSELPKFALYIQEGSVFF